MVRRGREEEEVRRGGREYVEEHTSTAHAKA
jgi:hypothetical protein